VRIVLVNKFAHVTGGADQHCLDLAAALTAAGHEVRMLSTADPANGWRSGAFIPVSTSAGTRDQTRLLDAAPVFFEALWHRGAAAAMRRLAADFRPDVVHAHKLYPQISVAPVVEAARLGLPVVQTLHDFEMISANHLDPGAGRLDLTETRLRYRALNTATFPIRRHVQLPRIRRFIAVSEVAAASHRRHGVDPVVIRNFAPAPPDSVPGWGERAGALYLGRLTESKGVGDVVELARAAPDVPVDIVGFGELGEELEAAAGEIPNLTYHGFVPREETVRRLLGARVALMPSLAPEGGPLVALQAMALGTPVVAYDAGGLGEYVRRGGGAVVDRGPAPLAAAVRRLVADENAWATMSEHGRAAVYAEHTPAAYVDRLERVYDAVA
jgi:glycosyltransferase involved in cell wall biosynthesis